MNRYKRYALLLAFGLVMFGVIFIFQHQMHKSNIHTYLQHETKLNKSLYHALALKHNGVPFEIEHILKIGHEITGAEYFLFDLNAKNVTLKDISEKIMKEIYENLQTEHDVSYPLEINKAWYVLSFVRCENDSNVFIVSLHKSFILQNIHDNRVKQLLILILVLGMLLVFFNKTLLYAQSIKIEKDKISLALSQQIEDKKLIANLNTSLNENLEYLRVLLDVVPIPIFVKDANNKYIECNKAFVAISGVTKNELLHKKVKDILASDLAEKHAQADLKLLSRDSIVYKERYNLQGAEPAIYELFKTVIIKEGKSNGYICAMVDITKHEAQEEYLEIKIKEEVARSMKQAQAYEQEKLRDVKFSAIGQLSAGITHEINTPLTYVKGNLEMMRMDMQDIQDSDLKEQLIKDTVNLEDGLNRIAKIIDSMREMSQQTRETKEQVNVYATLVTALILAHNRSKQISKIYLNKKEFNINADKNDYNCVCELQKQRIEQVWIVIISNALDELEKIDAFNDRELHIDCCEENEYVVIKFRDNAGGIDKTILQDIFEPFVSTKIHGGMGVGLSISKKILEEQNATIEAYNEDNGAVFEVKLLKCEV